MTTHALAQLAEQVMGLTYWPTHGGKRILAGRPKHTGPPIYCLKTHCSPEPCPMWTPNTDPAQALALLEAWTACHEHRAVNWHFKRDLHIVTLLAENQKKYWTIKGDTFPEAATLAVCAAEGIDPRVKT